MVKVWNEEFFLPFMLQYYETLGVDAIYIFEGGSTDSTPDILREWHKTNGNCIRNLVWQEEPHDEWFVKTVSEGKLINDAVKMIEDDGYDWIVKLDADEVFSTSMVDLIEHVKRGYSLKHGFQVPRIHLITDQYHRIWGNEDDATTWYPDYNVRFFNVKRNVWRHYEIKELDTQLFAQRSPVHIEELTDLYSIIHLHFLFEGRRHKRHGNRNDEDFQVNNTNYKIIEFNSEPQCPPMFIEWLEKKQIEWSKDQEAFFNKVK